MHLPKTQLEISIRCYYLYMMLSSFASMQTVNTPRDNDQMCSEKMTKEKKGRRRKTSGFHTMYRRTNWIKSRYHDDV